MDWIKVGKYVRTPNGSVKEILFVSEDNGVKLDDHKYYCASELQPASKPVDGDTTKPTIEWWDYENSKALNQPKEHTLVDVYFGRDEYWHTCEVLKVLLNGTMVVLRPYDLSLSFTTLDAIRPVDFKPKLTERQQAGLKLFRALNTGTHISDEEVLEYNRFEDYCKVFDQGLLK